MGGGGGGGGGRVGSSSPVYRYVICLQAGPLLNTTEIFYVDKL